ncbi:MAG: AAA family ATPase [Verrucomicrobia bacterium]|nr:AAA family ATPase [Cytophagales bacterium]
MPQNTSLLALPENFLSADFDNSNDFTPVFGEGRTYMHDYRFYFNFFKKIPNGKEIDRIDLRRAVAWFAEHYKHQIKDTFFQQDYDYKKKKFFDTERFFVLEDETLVTFNDGDMCRVLHHRADDNHFNKIIEQIRTFKRRRQGIHRQISLITQGFSGLEISTLDINKTKLDLSHNYNDDFAEVHEVIIKRLSKKNDKGIVLLHGIPGTGKTTYLRYLIGKVKKQMLFVPPNIAANMANPEFINILINNSNSVLIVEDAENIIIDRNQSGSSAVSTLLNISDGLLSDCLNIQIICSFNTHISAVDTALLRKGRLIAKYEFQKLHAEKAQKLSDNLGFKTQILEDTTLSDIYNQEEMDFDDRKSDKKIGFKS